MQPAQLGRYEIVGRLGRGGMGEVFEGFDPQLQRRVALKRLVGTAPREHRERLHREALSVAALSHPSIGHVYEIVTQDGQDWVVMEFVDGRPLSDMLLEGPLTGDQVVRVGIQVAEALAEAHRHGIIHRDIKAENVMCGLSGRVRVLDFGLAKWVGTRGVDSDALTQEGLVVGTARAMSPEQALGKNIDSRSDIFSLGSLLYELCSGRPAFRGETPMDTMVKVARRECPPLSEAAPHLAEGLVAVVERCMARDPEDRFQSADEVAQALGRLTATHGTNAPVARRPVRSWGIAILVLVGLVLGAGVGTVAGRWLGRSVRPSLAVAVLPLTGQLPGDRGRLAGAAVADAITARLARLERVQVVAGREVRAVAREGVRVAEIAAELGVQEVVEVSLTQEHAEAPARITLSRVAGATGRVLWSQELEVGTGDLLLLQDRVTQALTDAYQGYTLDQEMSERSVHSAALAAYLEVSHRLASATTSPNYREEVVLLEEALQQSPRFLEAAISLANIQGYLFQTTAEPGCRERAEALLSHARTLAPGDPRVVRAHVDLALRLNRPEEAEAQARALTASRPGDADAWSNLGLLLQRLGRLEEAELALRRAYGLRPYWRYLFSLADVYRERGDLAGARITLEDLLDRNPTNTNVRSRLAFVMYSAGDVSGAEQQYRTLAEERGDNVDCNNLGSMLLLLGRYEEAEHWVRQAVALAPHRASHRANLAKTLYWAEDTAAARGEFAAALAIAEEQIARDVDTARNRRTRALCLAHLGRGAEAVMEIQRALEAFRSDAYTLSVAATVAALNGDRHGILAWTTRAREAGALAVWFSGPEFAALRDDPAFAALLAGGSRPISR